MTLTITFDHERLNNIMANKLKVRVANPVADSRLGSGEEIVQNMDFMAKNHEAINEMRPNETCATSDEDTFSCGWREETDRGESREGRIRDGVILRMIDRL